MVHDIRPFLRGVVSVTMLPMTVEDDIDADAYERVVMRMADAGITCFTANGNTGEFYSLTHDELLHVARLTTAMVPDAAVIVGVGHELRQAVALAADAASNGASAIMVHQPAHPYRSAQGWVAYNRAIADAVPETSVIAYIRDGRIGAAEVSALADACPNFVGVKYAVPDLLTVAACERATRGRLSWVCGLAERWAPAFAFAGAPGFTSGLANIAPAQSLELSRLLLAGDQGPARTLWESLLPLEELRARDGDADNVSALKEAGRQLGLCESVVRPPSSALDEQDSRLVTTILESWNLL